MEEASAPLRSAWVPYPGHLAELKIPRKLITDQQGCLPFACLFDTAHISCRKAAFCPSAWFEDWAGFLSVGAQCCTWLKFRDSSAQKNVHTYSKAICRSNITAQDMNIWSIAHATHNRRKGRRKVSANSAALLYGTPPSLLLTFAPHLRRSVSVLAQ